MFFSKYTSNDLGQFSPGCSIDQIEIDDSRNALLTEFGATVLEDRYLYSGESFQEMFARVSATYSDDAAHAQRLYDYMSQMYFMPATPILSNGGTERGLPISCFLNDVSDSLDGIVTTWNENVWLASNGGGIGSYWGDVRSIGEKVRANGKTSGIMPFIAVQDRLTLAISQGSLRRGSAAMYLPVWHPEIEEFIEMRRPTGGDPNRKTLNLHHGVVINDAFMEAVEKGDNWELKSPKDDKIISVVSAREIWIRLLTTRMAIGEPYLLFIDAVNRGRPESYKKLGLYAKTSNLCSEITLITGPDHLNSPRTAVCCLSSMNLETYDEWKDNPTIVEDVLKFLDNVLEDFIVNAPDVMQKAKYSAYRERSVGLGVMGFHSFLQSKGIPFESSVAKAWNMNIFKKLRKEADEVSKRIAELKGPCPDAHDAGLNERFSHKIAIAPTASISIIAGNTSPGIEPYNSNAYTQKTLTGSFNVRNKHLKKLLQQKEQDTHETWSSIMNHDGSVSHLDFLSDDEKRIFKTAFEIDQRWVIEHAADRTPMVCQAQSVNLFLHADVHKKDLHMIHYMAWKKGLKSLYYNRSKSLQRAETVSKRIVQKQLKLDMPQSEEAPDDENKYEECLACQ